MIQIKEIKAGAKMRSVAVASGDTKKTLRRLAKELANESRYIHRAAHGFVRDRSPVTNALVHVGFEWSASMDMKDAFNSTPLPERYDRAISIAAREAIDTLRDNGVETCMQGLAVSPHLFNLSMIRLDAKCEAIATARRCVYSRYADDITISGESRVEVVSAVNRIRESWRDAGLVENRKKFRLMSAKFGRRIICGVSVGRWEDEKPVRACRAIRRKVRAGSWRKSKMNRRDYGRFHGQQSWVKHAEDWRGALEKMLGGFGAALVLNRIVPVWEVAPGVRHYGDDAVVKSYRIERAVWRWIGETTVTIAICEQVKCPLVLRRLVTAWRLADTKLNFQEWYYARDAK